MLISLHKQTRIAFYDYGNTEVRSLDSPLTIQEQSSEVWLAQAEWFFSDSLAIGEVYSFNTPSSLHNHLQPQQQAVRLLLTQLLNTIGVINLHTDTGITSTVVLDDILDETGYPYRLTPSNHYVSFSHSQHSVACALSHSPIGIDLEARPIPFAVAQRFFHPIERQWLQTLPPSEQPIASQILWSSKEAFIKKNNVDNLVVGLQVNHVAVAQGFIQQLYQQRVAKTQQTAFIESANSSMALNTAYPLTAFIEQSAQHWYLSLDCNDNFLVMVKDTD